MSKFPANDAKFETVRKLNLPLGQYAITSSGPLGIREMREIGDIDLIVTDDLWRKLTHDHSVNNEGFEKISLADGIDVLHFGSNYVDEIEGAPSTEQQIAEAEIIVGLPFVRLDKVLFFKERIGREKDEQDAKIIRAILTKA